MVKLRIRYMGVNSLMQMEKQKKKKKKTHVCAVEYANKKDVREDYLLLCTVR